MEETMNKEIVIQRTIGNKTKAQTIEPRLYDYLDESEPEKGQIMGDISW
jgi:hypothetical protein